jgi:uncharacterized glyoxalase superfamily protein PhnB
MTDTTATAEPPTTLHAYLGYRDAAAAIDWLSHALGFTTTMRFPDDDGGVAHAELRRGGAAIGVFTDRDGYDRPQRRGDTVGQGLYLCVGADEVDALWAAATDAGATGVWTPTATPWGNYCCRVLDPEGVEWTVGTHRPGLEDG